MNCDSATQESAAERAIEALSKRMLLYPMMQLVVRLPKAVYEPIYGFHSYKGDTSVNEFILACFTSVTEPSAGIGFLLIFLVMQVGERCMKACIHTCAGSSWSRLFSQL